MWVSVKRMGALQPVSKVSNGFLCCLQLGNFVNVCNGK